MRTSIFLFFLHILLFLHFLHFLLPFHNHHLHNPNITERERGNLPILNANVTIRLIQNPVVNPVKMKKCPLFLLTWNNTILLTANTKNTPTNMLETGTSILVFGRPPNAA